jgi:hypothetical protein
MEWHLQLKINKNNRASVLFGSTTNMGVPACTYSIGANGSNTTFLGRITNGVGAVSIAHDS